MSQLFKACSCCAQNRRSGMFERGGDVCRICSCGHFNCDEADYSRSWNMSLANAVSRVRLRKRAVLGAVRAASSLRPRTDLKACV